MVIFYEISLKHGMYFYKEFYDSSQLFTKYIQYEVLRRNEI